MSLGGCRLGDPASAPVTYRAGRPHQPRYGTIVRRRSSNDLRSFSRRKEPFGRHGSQIDPTQSGILPLVVGRTHHRRPAINVDIILSHSCGGKFFFKPSAICQQQ